MADGNDSNSEVTTSNSSEHASDDSQEPEEKPVGTLVVTFAFLAATIAVWLLMYYTLLSKA